MSSVPCTQQMLHMDPAPVQPMLNSNLDAVSCSESTLCTVQRDHNIAAGSSVVRNGTLKNSSSNSQLSPQHTQKMKRLATKTYVPTCSTAGPGYSVPPQAKVGPSTLRTYAVVCVGPPARGKTFFSNKLSRYLAWLGHGSRVFNLHPIFFELYRNSQHCPSPPPSQLKQPGFPESCSSSSTADTSSSTSTASNIGGSEPRKDCCYKDGLEVAATEFQLLNPAGIAMYHDVLDGCVERVRNFLTKPYHQLQHQQMGASSSTHNDCNSNGQVCIINDDFVTEESRTYLRNKLAPHVDEVIFLEIVRDSAVNRNFEQREYGDDDDPVASKANFYTRLEIMKKLYEQVKPPEKYMRFLNGQTMEVCSLTGFLPSRMASFLMNVSQMKVNYPIYFSRHGQSEYNLDDRLGGNPGLTAKGQRDAMALKIFIGELLQTQAEQDSNSNSNSHSPAVMEAGLSPQATFDVPPSHEENQNNDESEHNSASASAGWGSMNRPTATPENMMSGFNSSVSDMMMPPCVAASADDVQEHTQNIRDKKQANSDNKAAPIQIWTSQLLRTIQTGMPAEVAFNLPCLRFRHLNEIHAGVCEDLTYKEVREKYPLIDEFRNKNKYAFRYPEGESYQDLVNRLEPIIMNLENADQVVVVIAHQAILRVLLSYFGAKSAEHCVRVEVPQRTVWRVEYQADGLPILDTIALPEGPDPDPATRARMEHLHAQHSGVHQQTDEAPSNV